VNLYTVVAWHDREKTTKVISYVEEAVTGSIAMAQAVRRAREWNREAQPALTVSIVQIGDRETQIDDDLPLFRQPPSD